MLRPLLLAGPPIYIFVIRHHRHSVYAGVFSLRTVKAAVRAVKRRRHLTRGMIDCDVPQEEVLPTATTAEHIGPYGVLDSSRGVIVMGGAIEPGELILKFYEN